MSFVKHAIFVGENAPSLQDKEIVPYILNRFSVKNCLISEGVCDALDHSSPSFAQGGKLGLDCTNALEIEDKLELLDTMQLHKILSEVFSPSGKVKSVRQIYKETKNPIIIVGIDKKESLKKAFLRLERAKLESQHQESNLQNVNLLEKYMRIVVVVDELKNDLDNLYMLLWRVVNNIDAKRDIKIIGKTLLLDACDKDVSDDYLREWPKETDCSREVLDKLEKCGLLSDFGNLENFYRKFHIDKSYNTKM